MLDFIYYPVSAILWFWHKVFGSVLGASSGVAWALSVIFLVFTLRAVLFKPFVKQVRTQRQMQEFQPQIKALQKKYKGDRQRLAVEMQKLQKEHGFNPVAGCLPVLLQAPVFIGLYHVLRSFNRTAGNVSHIPFLSSTASMSVEQNRNTANYFFGVDDVRSFLDAKLFGAPLASYLTQPEQQLEAFGHVAKLNIGLVAVPLMVIASIATHFTARASVARQSATAAANPQSAMMNKLVLWVFPLGVLVGGPFLPVAILLYWLSNNGWTLVQQHYVFGKIAAEDDAKKKEAIERRGSNAPRPGARPEKGRKGKPVNGAGEAAAGGGSVSGDSAGSAPAASSASAPDSSGSSARGFDDAQSDAMLPAVDSTAPLGTDAGKSTGAQQSNGAKKKPLKAPSQANGRRSGKSATTNAKSRSARGSRKKR